MLSLGLSLAACIMDHRVNVRQSSQVRSFPNQGVRKPILAGDCLHPASQTTLFLRNTRAIASVSFHASVVHCGFHLSAGVRSRRSAGRRPADRRLQPSQRHLGLHLVDHEQLDTGAARADAGRGGGHILVDGDVAGQTAARPAVSSAAGTYMPWPRMVRQTGSVNAASACRRPVAGHDPANPLDEAGLDQPAAIAAVRFARHC